MNEVIRSICERRCIRHYKDKPIDKDLLEKIAWGGVQAPSGHNLQDWRITILHDSGRISEWKDKVNKAFERRKENSRLDFGNPAALILVSNWGKDHNAIANGACAIENMLLAAWSVGIGGVWLDALRTIQDEPEIRQMLSEYGIPDNYVVVGAVALGYLEEGELPPKPERRKDVIRFLD